MSSEIKVDTISENTSANGVAIDGVKLKDNILTVQGTSTTGGTIEIENTDTGGAANDYFGKLIFKGNDSSSSASGTRASVEGKVTGNFGSSQIDFLTASGGASAARIATLSPDGLSLADGNITFEGSGHGIHLGVTSATASNLLDDYEEGTFTATLGTTGTGFTTSSNTATCFYTKVGRAVSLAVSCSVASPTGGSGNLQLTGLPFASGSLDTGYSAAIRPGRITCTNGDGITANLFQSSSTISFEKAANASATTKIAASDLNGNTTPFLSFSMTYFTD